MKRFSTVLLLLLAASVLFAASMISEPAATVNLIRNSVITVEDLNAEVERYRNAGMTDVTVQDVLQTMINDEVFIQGAERDGITINDRQIDSLYRQIRVGLNASLSGIPYWTTDIGGFFGGDPEDESFRELLVRWFEFAVFSPVLRLHGKRLPYDKVDKQCDFDSFLPSCGDNEIWSFGDAVFRILSKQIRLREILKPYIREAADEAERDGRPIMRPLFYDYPEDGNLRDYSDAYLFGSDIIVSPIAEKGKRECDVYLPQGTEWISVPDGALLEGGRKHHVPAPLERIPFFIRKGSHCCRFIDEFGGWNE